MVEADKEFKLRPRQKEAIDKINNPSFKNAIVVLPTGYGKTVIGIEGMKRAMSRGERSIYISPLKALTSEQVETFESKGIKTKEITGETGASIEYTSKFLAPYNCYIFTFEKLESMILSVKRRTLFFEELKVTTLIIDEVHNIADKSRGANLELIIIGLKLVVPKLHVIGLSATIGNPEEFAKWLDADLILAKNDERPVPLEVKIEPYDEFTAMETSQRMEITENLLSQYPNSKTIIFVANRKKTDDLSKKIAMKMNYRSAMKAVASDNYYSMDNKENEKKQMEKAKAMIEAGACYHNAGLIKTVRKYIENEYKNNPKFKVITATTTLAQGVNLPADICILFETRRYNYLRSENMLYEPNEIHQMIGRAGRPGLSKFGLSIVFCESQDVETIEDYIKNPIDVHSKLVNDIKRKILEVLTGFVNRYDKLVKFFDASIDPIEHNVLDENIEWLQDNGFIEREGNAIKNTELGVKTAYAFIQPETALQIVETNNKIKELDLKFDNVKDYFWLFDTILLNDEFLNQVVIRSNTKNDRNCIYHAMRYYSFTDERIAKAFAFVFTKQIYIDANFAESKDNTIKFAPQDLFTLQSSINRILFGAERIFDKDLKTRKFYKNLEMMVESSFFDLELMKLYEIEGVGEKRLQKLVNAGIKTIDKFVDSDTSTIKAILNVSDAMIVKMLDSAQGIVEGKLSKKKIGEYQE